MDSSPFNQGCKRDFERDEGSATNRISSCCSPQTKPLGCLLTTNVNYNHFQLSIDAPHSHTFHLQRLQSKHHHTLLKVRFLSKNSIVTKTQTFSQVFQPNFFLTIFLVKSKLSTAKKSKTTTFSRIFHPKK